MSDAQVRFEALRLRFLERTRQDLSTIRTERDPAKLRPLVHRLAGAAGTFGYREISALAGEIDDLLVENRTPGEADLGQLIAALESAVAG